MSWTELITREVESNYASTAGLVDMVEDSDLDWKPATGDNWMTTGQVLKHTADACGKCFRGFVTGDWGLPEDFDPNDMSPENMLPPAEKLPTVSSVTEAKKLLEEDKQISFAMLKESGEEALANKKAPAPWDNEDMILGHRLLRMVQHLQQHKGQLFYYLKLMGKPVNTNHLWGP